MCEEDNSYKIRNSRHLIKDFAFNRLNNTNLTLDSFVQVYTSWFKKNKPEHIRNKNQEAAILFSYAKFM